MKWLKNLFSGSSSEPRASDSSTGPQVSWLEPDSPENPFGVRLLNLMGNLQLLSTSENADVVATAVSWRPGHQDRLTPKRDGEGIACDLNYPIGAVLPDGMLFIPQAMEDKWVIAWRDGAVIFARSWSGETQVTADANVGDGQLHLSRIYAEDAALESFGQTIAVVDWMMRSHAFNERIPLPIDAQAAEMLHGTPLVAMSAFGHRLFCAAVDYKLEPPASLLYSLGNLSAAIYANDAEVVRKLADDETWRTPVADDGSVPLVLASALGYTDLCRLMLELGSDLELTNARGGAALSAGVAGKHGREHVAMLLDAGANIEAANVDGFTALHASAEVDDGDMVRYLIERGANIESRTKAGYCPIHIAAGLGHRSAAEALVACGADPNVSANGQTPARICRSEGNNDLAAWFESQPS